MFKSHIVMMILVYVLNQKHYNFTEAKICLTSTGRSDTNSLEEINSRINNFIDRNKYS